MTVAMSVVIDRLISRVVETPGPLDTPCWITNCRTTKRGYAMIDQGDRSHRVHRVTYEASRGPVPQGLELDHLCRVRACCNPQHLEAVTHQENMRRAFEATGTGTYATHCLAGHEFTPATTLPNHGGRSCRVCHWRRMKEYHARLRADRAEAAS